jgi:hypothetical protein
MALEAAVLVDLPPVADSASDVPAHPGTLLTGIAVREGGQWASLCPELDIASVGSDATEAVNNLVQAVAEAVALAAEEGLQPGHPTRPDDVRAFIVGGDASFYVRKFYI